MVMLRLLPVFFSMITMNVLLSVIIIIIIVVVVAVSACHVLTILLPHRKFLDAILNLSLGLAHVSDVTPGRSSSTPS